MSPPDPAPDSHAARYYRSRFVVTGILLLIAGLLAGVAGLIRLHADADGWIANPEGFMIGIAGLTGGFLVAIGALAALGLPHHRWQIHPEGVAMTERLALPFRPPRRRLVRWDQVAGLVWRSEGFVPVLELRTTAGACHILPAAKVVGAPPDAAALLDFARRMAAAAGAAGQPLPPLTEGLGSFERAGGLVVLAVVAALLTAGSAALALAVLTGPTAMGPRSGAALGTLLAAAAGAVWLLGRSVARRRRIGGRSGPASGTAADWASDRAQTGDGPPGEGRWG